jgi:predicted nucleic acid-binding protein
MFGCQNPLYTGCMILYLSEMESDEPLFISVQTYGEIMAGVETENWGEKRQQFLETYLITEFSLLSIDKETASIYSIIRSLSARLGKSLTVPDSWIAATAKQYDLVLVSHDGDMRVASEF